jgi:SAM-dependent methyltransferase
MAIVRRLYQKVLRTLARKDVNKTDFLQTYPNLVRVLSLGNSHESAMKLAVGGEFEAVGILERETLIHFGLKKEDYLIDVGCGSGRLAKPLAQYLTGPYLGIDIVPELVEYARRIVPKADWRFEVADGLRIPEKNDRADMICFFSVLTHLLHEQSYAYLMEARRVMKPGGKIVFSFLDFAVKDHWPTFESSLQDLEAKAYPLNVFISKDGIRAWADHLDLQILSIEDGNIPFVHLPEPVVFENGSKAQDCGATGQSICVLSGK